ncbi:Serine/threonine-protein kinase KIN28 [Smittium culicis]|uniref:[RNA-polymerase]-subunit kinase n=1 Tax=Smittium culicis TaxID=133412 RepID=A0A1R1Y6P4_9FUNG|nr:Serine/threonine-protein kinase KIN28 [Smittium culicis]OMJ22588.1 Serine/threonine-protein kinase KIN28 [Smittium culicis]
MANEQVFAEDINKETEIHYKKDKKLGEGTYAVVYLGYDNRTGRKVAIKKIKLGSMKNGLDMSAIREIKALRELQHPNVIEVILLANYKYTFAEDNFFKKKKSRFFLVI